MKRVLATSLLIASLALSSCSVHRALQGTPGADISTVQRGITRDQVEACLGTPVRTWTTVTGVHYDIYMYDGGIPPNASDASALLFLDVISVGLTELFIQLDPTALNGPRKVTRIAVAYDSGDRVIGVFDDIGDFESLPEDGMPPD